MMGIYCRHLLHLRTQKRKINEILSEVNLYFRGMKNLKKSFLFFLFFVSLRIIAQQDSLTIYTYKVSSPKSEKDLINSYRYFKRIL